MDVNVEPRPTEPIFLYIPIVRLIVLSIISFGIYEVYWLYKNWNYFKERDSLNIYPFWRGVFGFFFCHSLLRKIHGDNEARAFATPTFTPSVLATIWVVMVVLQNAMSRVPGLAAGIIAGLLPSYLCFVPVQKFMNEVTSRRNPTAGYYNWSPGHVLCLALGVAIWALIFITETS